MLRGPRGRFSEGGVPYRAKVPLNNSWSTVEMAKRTDKASREPTEDDQTGFWTCEVLQRRLPFVRKDLDIRASDSTVQTRGPLAGKLTSRREAGGGGRRRRGDDGREDVTRTLSTRHWSDADGEERERERARGKSEPRSLREGFFVYS